MDSLNEIISPELEIKYLYCLFEELQDLYYGDSMLEYIENRINILENILTLQKMYPDVEDGQ
jgi:hypothetical protein